MNARHHPNIRVQDRPDIQVFTEIGIIANLTRGSVTKSLPGGMTYPQWQVLAHFSRTGDGQTPADLARALQVTKGAVTNTLQHMQGAGLLEVRADAEDGRKKRIFVTRRGAACHTEMLRLVRPHLDQLRGGFTDAEFETALPFLRALRIWLDENRTPGE
ncbi:MAG TPA: MarR family transcriptional regulator [Caulobacteraceae bacterium]|nr:MarR family transcriptional regulator [Caulobacteraceae bacterium]